MPELDLPPPPPRSVFVDTALLRAAFRVYGLLMPVTLAAAAAQFVHLLLNDAVAKRFGLDVPHPSISQQLLGICVTLPVDFAMTAVNLALVLGAIAQLDAGEPVTLQGAWDRGCAPGWPLFWANMRYQVLGLLGMFALIVPGILYTTRKMLYGPLMVLGGLDAETAFAQSPEWLYGHKLRLASACCGVAILQGLLAWFFAHGPLESTAHWLLSPLFVPFYAILDGLVFLQLRALRPANP